MIKKSRSPRLGEHTRIATSDGKDSNICPGFDVLLCSTVSLGDRSNLTFMNKAASDQHQKLDGDGVE